MKRALKILTWTGGLGVGISAGLTVVSCSKKIVIIDTSPIRIDDQKTEVYKILKTITESNDKTKPLKESELNDLIKSLGWSNSLKVKIVDKKNLVNNLKVNEKEVSELHGLQNITFSGLNNSSDYTKNFIGTVSFEFEWKNEKKIIKPIINIKNEIVKIIKETEGKSVSLNIVDLQKEIDKKFPDEKIKLTEVINEEKTWNNFEQLIMFSADGNNGYAGSLVLKHEYIENNSIDISDINSPVRKNLSLVLGTYSSKKIIEKDSLKSIVDKIYGVDEIEVNFVDEVNSTRQLTSGIQTIEFKGLHDDKSISKKYSGKFTISRKWNKPLKLESVSDKLNAILNADLKHKVGLKELNNKLMKDPEFKDENIEIKELTNSSSLRSMSNGEQIFMFSSKGNKKYEGSVILKHIYEIDTTSDLADENSQISKSLDIIVGSLDKTKSVDQNYLANMIDKIYGKQQIKVEVSNDDINNLNVKAGKQKIVFTGLHNMNDLNKKFKGSKSFQHIWNKKNSSKKSIDEIKIDIEKELKNQQNRIWNIADLENNINEAIEGANIKIEEIYVKEESWNTFKQILVFTTDEQSIYSGSLILQHEYHENNQISLNDSNNNIEKNIALILENQDDSKSVKQEHIQQIIDNIYGLDEIQVTIENDHSDSLEKQKITFTGLHNQVNYSKKYTGSFSLIHNWKTNRLLNDVKDKLVAVLDLNKNQKWNINDLNNEIAKNDALKNQGIVVEEIAGATNNDSLNLNEQIFVFNADGKGKYRGALVLKHQYIVDRTINIADKNKEVYKALFSLINSFDKTKEVSVQEISDLVNNIYGLGEIQVTIEDDHSDSLEKQKITFTGLHSANNPSKKYTGSFSLIHNWKTNRPLNDIKDKLITILDLNKNQKWNINDLNNEIDKNDALKNQGIVVEEISGTTNNDALNLNEQIFVFKADGKKNYSGTVILKHQYFFDKTIDISDSTKGVYKTLSSLMTSLDKTKEVSAQEISNLVNNIYGNGQIKVEVSNASNIFVTTSGKQKVTFTGLYNNDNNSNQKYRGEISFFHNWVTLKNLSDYININDLGEIDNNSPDAIKNEIIVKNLEARFSTFEVLDITSNSALIKGTGAFTGAINVYFSTKKLNMLAYIRDTDLGILPNTSNESIINAILKQNPQAKETSFVIKPTSDHTFIISGTGRFSGFVVVETQKPKKITDVVKNITKINFRADLKNELLIANKIHQLYPELVYNVNFILHRALTYDRFVEWDVIGINDYVGSASLLLFQK
ncbi:hypothetical protein ESOMN_v1c06820 [Williamsoniiplasma somnilux]|uniref:Lipoprotein n=1 Tax=Williamsoniiplasma somnilux TaxID=215578 RepID=A0A2K8NZ99_9MOLU|nr:hypothetical protein [Williamsoniiplasma somnilux]ATZ19064.1 hypothetical protein ESOMN_v1c06820 [Williamsoniiplasma somnilux]